jgi:KRAB domain-containing zinc finger protein
VCDKRFGNKKLLQQHVIVHTGEKNYPCPVCQAKFARNHVLRTHIQQLHKGYQLPAKGTVTSVRALQRAAQQLL